MLPCAASAAPGSSGGAFDAAAYDRQRLAADAAAMAVMRRVRRRTLAVQDHRQAPGSGPSANRQGLGGGEAPIWCLLAERRLLVPALARCTRLAPPHPPPRSPLQIWDLLEERDLADFPRPVHHRIPNFKGAVEAAAQLAALPEFAAAAVVKVNPGARNACADNGADVIV